MVGRYALHDLLSAGGMGQVHFGRLLGASGFSRVVAIKRLHAQFAADPEFSAMFLDEARLASRIHHPNVVATLDAVSEGGELFLVMEYVRGESLSKLLGAQTRPPMAHAVAIMVGALHGLHAAHEARSASGGWLALVHRDVSPPNILVGDDGVARIIDFGVAKAAERIHFTRTDDVRGKVAYMAPEQLVRGAVDRRADVYSAAVVLWELLTGRRFVNPDLADAAAVLAALGRPPEPPSALGAEVPRGVDDVVLRGLAREPSGRFHTALEMAAALEGVLVPSTQREVGAWVSSVAGESLRRKDETLKRIETEPAGSLARPSSSPSAPPTAGTWPTAGIARARPYGRVVALSAVVVVTALAWIGGTVYGRMRRSGPGVAPSEAVVTASPAAVSLAPPAPVAPSLAASSAAVPVAAADNVSPGSPDAAGSPSRAPSSKRSSCNPPYRVEHGIKVAKIECL
jgi:serine/threonine protein kinase